MPAGVDLVDRRSRSRVLAISSVLLGVLTLSHGTAMGQASPDGGSEAPPPTVVVDVVDPSEPGTPSTGPTFPPGGGSDDTGSSTDSGPVTERPAPATPPAEQRPARQVPVFIPPAPSPLPVAESPAPAPTPGPSPAPAVTPIPTATPVAVAAPVATGAPATTFTPTLELPAPPVPADVVVETATPALLPTPPPAEPALAPLSLVLNPSTAFVTTNVTVSGGGCPARSTVHLNAEGRELARVPADGSGRFQAPVSLSGFGAGRRVVTAACDGVTVSAVADVVLGGAIPAAGSGTVGVVVCFFLLLLLLISHPFGGPEPSRPRPARRGGT